MNSISYDKASIIALLLMATPTIIRAADDAQQAMIAVTTYNPTDPSANDSQFPIFEREEIESQQACNATQDEYWAGTRDKSARRCRLKGCPIGFIETQQFCVSQGLVQGTAAYPVEERHVGRYDHCYNTEAKEKRKGKRTEHWCVEQCKAPNGTMSAPTKQADGKPWCLPSASDPGFFVQPTSLSEDKQSAVCPSDSQMVKARDSLFMCIRPLPTANGGTGATDNTAPAAPTAVTAPVTPGDKPQPAAQAAPKKNQGSKSQVRPNENILWPLFLFVFIF